MGLEKILASLLLVTSVYAGVSTLKKEYINYTFNEEEINHSLKEHLPYGIDYMYVFHIDLNHAKAKILPNSRIEGTIDTTVSMILGTSRANFEAKVTLSSGLEYFSRRESLYLSRPVIEHIEIDTLPSEYVNIANSAISTALLSYYRDNPVYTLTLKDKQEIGHKIVDVTIEPKTLRVIVEK